MLQSNKYRTFYLIEENYRQILRKWSYPRSNSDRQQQNAHQFYNIRQRNEVQGIYRELRRLVLYNKGASTRPFKLPKIIYGILQNPFAHKNRVNYLLLNCTNGLYEHGISYLFSSSNRYRRKHIDTFSNFENNFLPPKCLEDLWTSIVVF